MSNSEELALDVGIYVKVTQAQDDGLRELAKQLKIGKSALIRSGIDVQLELQTMIGPYVKGLRERLLSELLEQINGAKQVAKRSRTRRR